MLHCRTRLQKRRCFETRNKKLIQAPSLCACYSPLWSSRCLGATVVQHHQKCYRCDRERQWVDSKWWLCPAGRVAQRKEPSLIDCYPSYLGLQTPERRKYRGRRKVVPQSDNIWAKSRNHWMVPHCSHGSEAAESSRTKEHIVLQLPRYWRERTKGRKSGPLARKFRCR